MSDQSWKATGLTCNHCAMSVTKNLMELSGMSSVEVDVKPNQTSNIQTHGAREFTAQEISNALRQAGKYVLASSPSQTEAIGNQAGGRVGLFL